METSVQSQPASTRRLDLVWLGVVALLTGVVFFYDLGKSSLWFDEAATYQFAVLPWGTLWQALHHGDAFYGFYYALMHVWVGLFGPSELSLRAPSALVAAAALFPAFALARTLFDRTTAWVCVLAVACNPFYYILARDARPYPMFFFLSCTLSLMFLQAVARSSRSTWIRYAAIALVGMYMHLFTVFVIVAHGIFLLLSRKRAVWLPYLAAASATALCCLPVAWLTLHDENSQNTWLARPNFHTIRELVFVWSGSHHLEHFELLLIAIACILAGWRMARVRSVPFGESYLFAGCTLFVPIVLVLAISQKKPIYFANYMIAELFAFTLLYSRGIAALGLRRGCIPALLLLVALDVGVLHTKESFEMQNWRDGARLLSSTLGSNDAILIFPPRGYAVLDYYAPHLAHSGRVIYPHGDLPIWESEREPFAPSAIVDGAAARYGRIWLVSNGLGGGKEPGEEELDAALARYYRIAGSTALTRLRIVELVRTKT